MLKKISSAPLDADAMLAPIASNLTKVKSNAAVSFFVIVDCQRLLPHWS
jgi:hypothetical protein